VLDTAGQIRRKEQYETALQQLETDIERLQRASAVLIRK
jgi:exonuclease VII small subunit